MPPPPIPPDDARRWAESFEAARARSAQWDQATFPRADRLIYLVADGLYSTSVDSVHWSLKLAGAPAAQELPGTFRAFSYAGYREHYLPHESAQTLETLVDRWDAYLARLRPNQRLIPVCFSLGAAVALVALRRRCALSSIAESVPAAVLVAPAHAPALELLDGYLAIAGDLGPHGIPVGVRELCNPSNPLRAEAAASLQDLPRNGIRLHIIFWSADRLTLYTRTASPGLDEREVLRDKSLDRVRDAAKEHINLRDHLEVTTALCDVLAGYPAPSNAGK